MNEFETAPLPSDRPKAEVPVAHASETLTEPPIIDHDAAAHVPPPEPERAATGTAPQPAPVVRRGGGSNLLTVVLFLLLAGGLYYVWSTPNPNAAANGDQALATLRHQVQAQADQVGQASTQMQTLTQQVQGLSDRVDKLEKSVAAVATQAAAAPAPAAPAADTGDLGKRIDDLSARVEALANRPVPAAPAPEAPSAPPDSAAASQAGQQAAQQAVAELGQKLDQSLAAQNAKLEQALAAANARVDQLVAQQKAADDTLAGRLDKVEQGAGQVESTADRAARLARVQAAGVALDAGDKLGAIPGAPPALARFADTAPPTEAALREAFPAVSAHAREVSRPDLSRKSFLERTLSRLQQSVTVRQGDDVLVGDPAAGVLADAETKVQNADLAGAVKVLGHLHGPAAQAVQGWVDQANALVAARQALAAMAVHP
jgi:hypothetical protein